MSWLWKNDASSPASFEKALSKLSTQITNANLALETTRSRGRRVKALWTLYTTLAYVLSLLILVLIIGPQRWSLPHYISLVGAPAFIYAVRFLLTTVFEWRAGRQQTHLNTLQKQRESKIADLKKATKYDSTQELLQKYGGVPPKEASPKGSPQSDKKTAVLPQQQVRTGLPPPPTANIQTRPAISAPLTPRPQAKSPISPQFSSPATPFSPDAPEFAPNAFSSQPQRAAIENGHNWYDRILDVLLGEDETQAKNRLVLICQNCRLVNGQAPPGVRTLEDLGKWRCANCGSWNGQESEVLRAVKEMTQKPRVLSKHESEMPQAGTEVKNVEEQGPHSEDETSEATGVDQDSAVTKRVTRSAGEQLHEGL